MKMQPPIKSACLQWTNELALQSSMLLNRISPRRCFEEDTLRPTTLGLVSYRYIGFRQLSQIIRLLGHWAAFFVRYPALRASWLRSFLASESRVSRSARALSQYSPLVVQRHGWLENETSSQCRCPWYTLLRLNHAEVPADCR